MKKYLIVFFILILCGCGKKDVSVKDALDILNSFDFKNQCYSYHYVGDGISKEEKYTISEDNLYIRYESASGTSLSYVKNDIYYQAFKENNDFYAYEKNVKKFSYDFNQFYNSIPVLSFYNLVKDLKPSLYYKSGDYRLTYSYLIDLNGDIYDGELTLHFNEKSFIEAKNECEITSEKKISVSEELKVERSFIIYPGVLITVLDDNEKYDDCLIEELVLDISLSISKEQEFTYTINEDVKNGYLKLGRNNHHTIYVDGVGVGYNNSDYKYYNIVDYNFTTELSYEDFLNKYNEIYNKYYPFMAYLNGFKDCKVSSKINDNNDIVINISYMDETSSGVFEIKIKNYEFKSVSLIEIKDQNTYNHTWTFNYDLEE